MLFSNLSSISLREALQWLKSGRRATMVKVVAAMTLKHAGPLQLWKCTAIMAVLELIKRRSLTLHVSCSSDLASLASFLIA